MTLILKLDLDIVNHTKNDLQLQTFIKEKRKFLAQSVHIMNIYIIVLILKLAMLTLNECTL